MHLVNGNLGNFDRAESFHWVNNRRLTYKLTNKAKK